MVEIKKHIIQHLEQLFPAKANVERQQKQFGDDTAFHNISCGGLMIPMWFTVTPQLQNLTG